MKSFLIIGMGSFGHHLCRALSEQKCEIMAVDRSSAAVEDVLPLVVSAKVGDCANEDVLRSFGVESFDACFVCLGDDVLGSLQITSLLKELGAKKVFSKAEDDLQAKFLLRNGADEIDMVINQGMAKAGDWEGVLQEIKGVKHFFSEEQVVLEHLASGGAAGQG